MTVDPGERELLAQLLRVTVVRLDVNRALEEERFVETVQLLLNRLGSALSRREFIAHGHFPRFPDLQHGFLEQPHVAWRWLEQGEFVCEQSFEFGLRHVDRAAARAAVVVRVVLSSALRPAAG
ncbi:MAG TPA: hypothetical protein VM791_04915 [Vicinamibacterales bacterium]|nr:hypothetical protein [Vicinamibacterales bacterium]